MTKTDGLKVTLYLPAKPEYATPYALAMAPLTFVAGGSTCVEAQGTWEDTNGSHVCEEVLKTEWVLPLPRYEVVIHMLEIAIRKLLEFTDEKEILFTIESVRGVEIIKETKL